MSTTCDLSKAWPMSQTPVILGVGMNLAPRASNREAARVCNQAGGTLRKANEVHWSQVRWLVSHPTVFLPNLSQYMVRRPYPNGS